MNHKNIRFLTQAAMIAAIYVILTFVFAAISFGEVQVRIAEALSILPVFTPAAIPGLWIGCLLGNLLGGGILPDMIFGSIATGLGAAGTYALRGKSKFLAPLPPILANTIVVPLTLKFAYGVNLPLPLLMLSVGAGELISCGVLGLLLYPVLDKYRSILFKDT